MLSSHNMKTRRQQKALLHHAETSKLTENSIEYKAVKLCNVFKEIGLQHLGVDQEQNRMLHRFCRHLSNVYLNDNFDILTFVT